LNKNFNLTAEASWAIMGPSSLNFQGVGAVGLNGTSDILLQAGVVYAWGQEKSADSRVPASSESAEQKLRRLQKDYHVGQRWSLIEGWVDVDPAQATEAK
jgi:hypothetical protein